MSVNAAVSVETVILKNKLIFTTDKKGKAWGNVFPCERARPEGGIMWEGFQTTEECSFVK